MDNLGLMEPEELLRLLAGALTCAAIIFLFLAGYFFAARRGGKTRKRTLGTGGFRQDVPSSKHSVGASPAAESPVTPTPLVGGESLDGDRSRIDVSARLAGTGREAWLEEVSPHPSGTPAAEEHAPHGGREVLRLVRDPLTEQIWTQVAGMRYRSLNDIRDRAVGERVLAAITHALRFSNGMVATDRGVVTLELPPCDAVKVPTAFGVLSETREPDEMMCLMSDPDQDHFCVHVADRCYRRLTDVNDRATGQYILEAITRLLQFSNGMLATNDGFGVVPVPSLGADVHTPLPTPPAPSSHVTESADPSPSLPMPHPDSQLPVPSSTPSAAPLDEQERFLRQLMSQTPSEAQTPIERPSLRSSLRRMRKKSSDEPLPSLNLADEINRIFQSKLAASSLATADAQIETNPDGGVRIRIGTVYYSSPDEVPDPNLRDLLKLSIAEWERG